MKNSLPLRMLLLIIVSNVMLSCIYEDHPRSYGDYRPVIMTREHFENAIKFKSAQPMQNAGKIYVFNDWIFISDTNKGFHIYDNSNPEAPVLKSFFEVPGATDLAIRSHTVFINQATDLISIQLDPGTNNFQLLKRIPNTFPIKYSPQGYSRPVDDHHVVVDWIK